METILKNGKLTITIDADEKATKASATGKTRIVASSRGNLPTEIKIDGKTVRIGVNAYIEA